MKGEGDDDARSGDDEVRERVLMKVPGGAGARAGGGGFGNDRGGGGGGGGDCGGRS